MRNLYQTIVFPFADRLNISSETVLSGCSSLLTDAVIYEMTECTYAAYVQYLYIHVCTYISMATSSKDHL